MSGVNLSEWAIRHKTLVIFFMIVALAAGAMSYQRLGREEDPTFAIATMTIQTMWPGGTTLDTMQQVTDRIEKKLQETPSLDYVKSFTKPGVSVVYVNLKDSTNPADIPDIWYQVRKKVGDMRQTLPSGVQGPYFNDEFGDVFGVIYGLTFDGITLREARDFAEEARTAFLGVKDVAKVQIFGDQAEKIYLDISQKKLAALGLNLDAVMNAIAAQNAVVPTGIVNTAQESILIETSGALIDARSLSAINLYIKGQFYRLVDLATIKRGYVDPPTKIFRVNGKQAIGLGISMQPGGNILELGDALHKVARELEQRFPIGLEVNLVSDQPVVVEEAISGFTKALLEAVVIVLAVSFLSLGMRAGLVVAISIPLVLAIVFVSMEMLGTSLQRISLGALIISLGLLVDDAMITVEMMISKIEEGYDKAKAATFAYVSTAFPMLTGTLVTIIGFVPIGFAHSNVGQYCFSLFSVILVALVTSWFVAVLFAPVIGTIVLPDHIKAKHGAGHGAGHDAGHDAGHGAPKGRAARAFRHVLLGCMRFRYITLLATIGLFALAIYGERHIQQQFFPASDRPELLVTMMLPKNASMQASETTVDQVQKLLDGNPAVVRYSNYIGGGAIRFYLPLDVQLDNSFMSQFVIVAKDLVSRDALEAQLAKAFADDFPDVLARVSRLELGPPVGWPVQYRVSAASPSDVRVLAEQVAAALRANSKATLVNFDWGEKNKTIHLAIDQDKARLAGLSSQDIAETMNTILTGSRVTQLRDSIYLIDVLARAPDDERLSLGALRSTQISLPDGKSVPLIQIADIDYTLDEGYLWQRDRLPTITVQADVMPGVQAPTVYAELRAQMAALRAKLKGSERIAEGGTVEKSAQSNAAVMAQIPLMILLMLTVLMIQLQSFQRLFLVISVAPLGLIGVVAVMLPTGTPMGFVSSLGIIALAGMIIRNSVILLVQIEHNRQQGVEPWQAVIEATEHRVRPILLTAAAAILGMIPIMGDVFWGPMAFAVVGGLAGATALTLVFLPALYVAWFRLRPPGAPPVADRPGIESPLGDVQSAPAG